MTGRLFIDGHDAYSQWGVYVVNDGWNELIAYPPLKAVESNDWQEYDGIEADLSDPKLNTKEATLKLGVGGLFGNVMELIELLADGAYHTFNCAYIGRQYKLRMTQMPNLDYAKRLGIVSIKLCNDFPLDGYTYQAPASDIMSVSDYLLDGDPFTKYGCRILKGSLSEVMKTASVKENLLRNIPSQSGAIYDGQRVTFKSKDVKLNCLMRANTLAGLWRNYDALLYDLIRPGERMLEVAELEQTFPCHYKSASVSQFYPADKIWLAFTITFTFTRDLRIEDNCIILATESGVIVNTQDNVNAINMKPNTILEISNEED